MNHLLEAARRTGAAALLTVPLVVTGHATAASSPTPLRISGSTTLLPVMEEWVAALHDRQPDLQIELAGGGTTAGINDLVEGRTEVAMASRPATDDELESARRRGLDLERVDVVFDTLAVIVNRANPVETLTGGQVSDLFTGRAASWQQVSGEAVDVVVVARNPGAHTEAVFEEDVLRGAAVASSARRVADRAEMLATVAATPAAIGFTGLADALNSEQHGEVRVVRLLLDGSDAGTYAIRRPLAVYVASPRTEAVARFLDFVLGDDGQAMVVEGNFLPLHEPAAGD